jgi:hypothetical protein
VIVESETDRIDHATTPDLPEAPPTDEALVRDGRAGLTPAEMVERKLVTLLNGTALPLSRLHTSRTERPMK